MRKYDVVATTGSYEKDGQTKYLSKNVGTVIETQKGLRLKLDASFNPAGLQATQDGSVWLALFEPKPRDGQTEHAQQKANAYQKDAPFDDDFEV